MISTLQIKDAKHGLFKRSFSKQRIMKKYILDTFAEALENYYEALKLEDDPYDISYILYNIGLIYSNNGESITYGKGLFLSGGYGSVNTMAYSYDGINWTGLGKSSTNGIHTDRCRAVAFGNNMFVPI